MPILYKTLGNFINKTEIVSKSFADFSEEFIEIDVILWMSCFRTGSKSGLMFGEILCSLKKFKASVDVSGSIRLTQMLIMSY